MSTTWKCILGSIILTSAVLYAVLEWHHMFKILVRIPIVGWLSTISRPLISMHHLTEHPFGQVFSVLNFPASTEGGMRFGYQEYGQRGTKSFRIGTAM